MAIRGAAKPAPGASPRSTAFHPFVVCLLTVATSCRSALTASTTLAPKRKTALIRMRMNASMETLFWVLWWFRIPPWAGVSKPVSKDEWEAPRTSCTPGGALGDGAARDAAVARRRRRQGAEVQETATPGSLGGPSDAPACGTALCPDGFSPGGEARNGIAGGRRGLFAAGRRA